MSWKILNTSVGECERGSAGIEGQWWNASSWRRNVRAPEGASDILTWHGARLQQRCCCCVSLSMDRTPTQWNTFNFSRCGGVCVFEERANPIFGVKCRVPFFQVLHYYFFYTFHTLSFGGKTYGMGLQKNTTSYSLYKDDILFTPIQNEAPTCQLRLCSHAPESMKRPVGRPSPINIPSKGVQDFPLTFLLEGEIIKDKRIGWLARLDSGSPVGGIR